MRLHALAIYAISVVNNIKIYALSVPHHELFRGVHGASRLLQWCAMSLCECCSAALFLTEFADGASGRCLLLRVPEPADKGESFF